MTIERFAPLASMDNVARGLMWHSVMSRAEVSRRTGVNYQRLRRMDPLDTGLTIDELLDIAEQLYVAELHNADPLEV